MKRVNSISGKSAGRRPGNGDTKAAIITAAQEQFAKQGYDRATMRQVASLAGVDPALIVHYFGSKQELFVAAMMPLFDGPKLLPGALAGHKDEIGLRLATLFVTVSSNPASQRLMLGLFRSISSEEKAAAMVRKFVQDNIMTLVEQHLTGADKELQANLLGSQMVGFFIARYVLKVEPLASANQAQVIQYLAPRLQVAFN